MKLLIFGATGGVGSHVLQQALDQGHDVTVFARTPSKVTEDRASVVQGDAFDRQAVAAAVVGQDVVISCLGSTQGPEKNTSLRTMGGNIAEAIEAAGVRRVVWCASEGVDGEIPGLFGKFVMKVLAKPLADHRAAIERLRASGATLTVVRPRALNDGPLTTDYVEDFDGPSRGGYSISRASVAHFMVKCLDDPRYENASVAIGKRK